MEALAVPARDQVRVDPQTTHSPSTSTAVEAVLAALANPKYTWRTTDGIVRETHLQVDEVNKVLSTDLRDVVIRAAAPDAKGRALYTTRTRYKKTRSLRSRILSALTDQVR